MKKKSYYKIYNSDQPNHGYSSIVREIRYDDVEKTLFVDFHNGNKFKYLSVPDHVAEEAFNADSVGKYLIAKVFKIYEAIKLS